MSLSKEHLVISIQEPRRRPMCSRCRYHGIIVPKKGHNGLCPFHSCQCSKCAHVPRRSGAQVLHRGPGRVPDDGRPRGLPGAPQVRSGRNVAFSFATPEGGARPPAAITTATYTWSPMKPPSSSCPEAGGGLPVSGPDSREVPPFTPNSSYFDEPQPMPPVPFIPFPFVVPHHEPSGFPPLPNFLPGMQWLPPATSGLCSNGLCGHMRFHHSQQSAAPHPPPANPGHPALQAGLCQPSSAPSPAADAFRAAPTTQPAPNH